MNLDELMKQKVRWLHRWFVIPSSYLIFVFHFLQELLQARLGAYESDSDDVTESVVTINLVDDKESDDIYERKKISRYVDFIAISHYVNSIVTSFLFSAPKNREPLMIVKRINVNEKIRKMIDIEICPKNEFRQNDWKNRRTLTTKGKTNTMTTFVRR